MEKVDAITALRNAIVQLEDKRHTQAKALNMQLHETYESLKPINLIKSTFKEITVSTDLKDNLLNTTIAVTAGFLSKKAFESVSGSPFKKLIGSALMFGITNIVSKHPGAIKAFGNQFLKAIRPSVRLREDGAPDHQ